MGQFILTSPQTIRAVPLAYKYVAKSYKFLRNNKYIATTLKSSVIIN